MEHALLRSRNTILGREGIPFSAVRHLVQGSRFYDENLKQGYSPDREVQEINRMESSLGTLSPKQVDLRVAADFCCIWRYDYPQRVRDICAIIGGGSHSALRLHYQICPSMRRELHDYACALQGWVEDAAVDDGRYDSESARRTAEHVYGLLGSPDPLKKLLAERTFIGLSMRAVNCSFWGVNDRETETDLQPFTVFDAGRDARARLHELESRIRQEMGGTASNFLCDVGGAAEPACHFKFKRRVDVLVSSIGCMKWRGNLPPKDDSIRGRRGMTNACLEALYSYWSRSATPGGDAGDIFTHLDELLGEPSDFTRWLVACLWKNIKNQTEYHAYPMKHWVEFVRIAEDYLDGV